MSHYIVHQCDLCGREVVSRDQHDNHELSHLWGMVSANRHHEIGTKAELEQEVCGHCLGEIQKTIRKLMGVSS